MGRVGRVPAYVLLQAVAAMNEAARTDTQILVQAALDFIEHMENGWDVDRDESENLREAISLVLRHIYG